MPLKDKSIYPDDWKDRRKRILDREGHKCKFCGVPNYAVVMRNEKGVWRLADIADGEDYALTGRDKPTRIVLTIAHLDRGPKDCPDDRLAALCQRCHLGYDIKLHVSNAAETRRLKKEKAGQISLI